MVPALLSLELMRRVLEEEFRRVAFLKQIAAAHPNVADLQFLNVQFSGKFDVGLKKGRDSEQGSSTKAGGGDGSGAADADAESTVALQGSAKASAADTSAKIPTSAHAPSPQPLQVQRFKSTKEVHTQWVEDLQHHLHHLCDQISGLVRPGPVGGLPAPTAAATADGSGNSEETPTIPLPVALVYRLLAHVNTLRTITSAHSINGFAQVQATHKNFTAIMKDLLAARSRILAIVSAMTWPMRKKLDWLRLKYNTLLEESAATTKQVGDYHKLVERYEKDIATYKASILQVDREKHTIEYRRTRILQLGHHDPQIQQLIIEHCTDEYFQKLSDVRAREARLNATIAQFSSEFDHLNAQSETLKAAQRSLSIIDQAQSQAERDLEQRPGIHTPTFDPLGGAEAPADGYPDGVENRNSHAAPKVPPPVSDLLLAVDGFVQTQRLAEAVEPSELVDPPQKDPLNAKKVADAAKAREEKRRLRKLIQQRMMNRPRLPLFGQAAMLQSRQQPPTLPAKVRT